MAHLYRPEYVVRESEVAALLLNCCKSPSRSSTGTSGEIPSFPSCGRITGNPHLTLVSVGCCSRARVCLDRRSETQIFVDPAAFLDTNPSNIRKGHLYRWPSIREVAKTRSLA